MLEELKSQHREVARLMFEGYKYAEIASQMNMSIESIRQIARDPLCKSAVAKLQDSADHNIVDVRRRLAEMNLHALDVIEGILRDGTAPAPTQLKAAESVLDRNGYGAVQRTENITAHLSKDDLDEIKRRAFGDKLPAGE